MTKLDKREPLVVRVGPMIRGMNYQRETKSRERYREGVLNLIQANKAAKVSPLGRPRPPTQQPRPLKPNLRSSSHREIQKEERQYTDEDLVEPQGVTEREFIYRRPSVDAYQFKSPLPQLYTKSETTIKVRNK